MVESLNAALRPRLSRRPLLLVLGLGACAEMRQAPPLLPISALTSNTADPIRGAMQAMTPALADQGRGLAGRPAEAAQAAAQLEFVTAAIPRDSRYAAVPDSVRRDFLLARTELRDALGVAEDAAPEPVVRALVTAAQALRRGDAARAAAALPAPMFRPGGERSVQRLGELGPLPQCAIASANLTQVVARLDATGGWPGGKPSETNANIGSTFGFGADTSVGY
ncbi:hypothetical protein [Roseicella sp. DB1501]|uniref:hypothetical protein n=1 Tax=Roseicella sp. DB1501 TaxID=2730925 RepID=UPI001493265E|nr:hypothetical protein [Roseicella sp. DB1501]NOG74080.1 hypothetical protein [Roseicella sp. DB1501]